MFWFVLCAALALAIFSFISLARRKAITNWDIALIFVPFFAWWALALMNLRLKSLSNLIEPFALIVFIALLLTIRAFAVPAQSQPVTSRIVFVIGLTAAIVLYIFVPALPE